MLGVYSYTVILTYVGMLTAFAGIAAVLNGNIQMALACLMVAGLCDMFDGKVASTKKNRSVTEKRFGIQIDSLSDLIAFGVLPALILYEVSGKGRFGFCAAGFYVLGALIRLAHFNVEEETRQEQTEERRKVYLGLPVTTTALIFPAAVCVAEQLKWQMGLTAPILLLIIAILFVTPFQIRKPGNSGKLALLFLGVIEFLWLMKG